MTVAVFKFLAIVFISFYSIHAAVNDPFGQFTDSPIPKSSAGNGSYSLTLFRTFDALVFSRGYKSAASAIRREDLTVEEEEEKTANLRAVPRTTERPPTTKSWQILESVKDNKKNDKTPKVSGFCIGTCVFVGFLIGWIMMEYMDDRDVMNVVSVGDDLPPPPAFLLANLSENEATAGNSQEEDNTETESEVAIPLPPNPTSDC